MTYAGLTISDKPALLDAKARGAEWVANDADGSTYWYTDEPVRLVGHIGKWDNPTGEYGRVKHDLKIGYEHAVNIDLALAQIAEMESEEEFNKQYREMLNNASIPTGINIYDVMERKPMTWNERINQMTVEEKAKWLYDLDVCRVSSISIDECNSYRHCTECMRNMLNSPYMEGATK